MVGTVSNSLRKSIDDSKVLVVGAGGIGCELLKNLVLTGFNDITTIDLDTIDVSNLNRQFLFRKEHVGKSKAEIAKESAEKMNPNSKIDARLDNIMSSEYNVDFYKQFNFVMNALDNLGARNHVNKMCIKADVPLIESGSAGYLGQVSVIKKDKTECYSCQPKPTQKSYPGCTIRNTPSEPIHCIVWAKHLFNQLFGEDDPDQDVSPDTEDPEAAGEAGAAAASSEAKTDAIGGIERKSTRAWASEIDYETQKLFKKFFTDDITYLLSMHALWKERRPPVPLDFSSLPDTFGQSTSQQGGIKDQRVWSIKECAQIFGESIGTLKGELSKQGSDGILVWDKDDEAAMNFVCCVANIRAYIFGIPTKSRFDIKSMAGNIIPAIATTNAVIAGLIVLEALKILKGKIDECKSVYFIKTPNFRKKCIVPCSSVPPNPKCYICGEFAVGIHVNAEKMTLSTLENKVLKESLKMLEPEVSLDGTASIVLSSDEDADVNMESLLKDMGIEHGVRLNCDDFGQECKFKLDINHDEELDKDQFKFVNDLATIFENIFKVKNDEETDTVEKSDSPAKQETQAGNSNGNSNVDSDVVTISDEPDGPIEIDDDNDDDNDIIEITSNGSSAKRDGCSIQENESKRIRIEDAEVIEDDDDIIML